MHVLVDWLGFYNIYSPPFPIMWSYITFCHVFTKFCDKYIMEEVDRDVSVVNMYRRDLYYSFFPRGQSWKISKYYMQLINSGNLRRYDYGEK